MARRPAPVSDRGPPGRPAPRVAGPGPAVGDARRGIAGGRGGAGRGLRRGADRRSRRHGGGVPPLLRRRRACPARSRKPVPRRAGPRRPGPARGAAPHAPGSVARHRGQDHPGRAAPPGALLRARRRHHAGFLAAALDAVGLPAGQCGADVRIRRQGGLGRAGHALAVRVRVPGALCPSPIPPSSPIPRSWPSWSSSGRCRSTASSSTASCCPMWRWPAPRRCSTASAAAAGCSSSCPDRCRACRGTRPSPWACSGSSTGASPRRRCSASG